MGIAVPTFTGLGCTMGSQFQQFSSKNACIMRLHHHVPVKVGRSYLFQDTQSVSYDAVRTKGAQPDS